MVESKFVVLQMIPHTLFIEWDFGHCSHIWYYSYDQFFFFFKCSFLDLFNLKFYA